MNNFFIKLYSSIQNNNLTFSKIKYYSAQRFIIRLLANFLTPLSFHISNFLQKKPPHLSKKNDQLIVSLTTFPVRINKIWIVIECVLRQTHQPSRIILWLSKEQFKNENNLPKRLLKLKKRGLEIVFCERDIRSHKKYYYTLKEFPKSTLITVDDDFIYPTNMIAELLTEHKKDPTAICCHRAHQIKTKNNTVLPYHDWSFCFDSTSSKMELFFTSGGGTLFPPSSLYKETLNKDIFMKICKMADDVWLNAMAQLQNTSIIKVPSKHAMHIPIIINNNVSLKSTNVVEGQNDVQIEAVRNHFKSTTDRNIFEPIPEEENHQKYDI